MRIRRGLMMGLCLGLFFLVGSSLFAGDPFLDEGLPKMKKDLALTATQVKKIQDLYAHYKEDIVLYSQKKSLSQSDVEDVQRYQSKLEASIRDVFTKTQLGRLEKFRKQELVARQKQMHTTLMAQLTTALSLDKTQVKKTDAILSRFEEKIMPIILTSSTASPEIIQKINQLKLARDKEIDLVLSPKQQALFEDLKASQIRSQSQDSRPKPPVSTTENVH